MKLRKGFISVVFAVALCLSMGVGAAFAAEAPNQDPVKSIETERGTDWIKVAPDTNDVTGLGLRFYIDDDKNNLRDPANRVERLEEGTTYTIWAFWSSGGNPFYQASEPRAFKVTTKVTIKGQVTGVALPATMTLSTSEGPASVQVGENGKYEAVVPVGKTDIMVVGADGLKMATGTIDASKENKLVGSLKVKNTAKGDAKDFIDQYLTDDQGNVITEVTADNYAQIVAAQKALESLSADAQKLVKQQMGSPFDATTAAADAADKFIEDNLTDANGNVITEATADNYKQILDAKAKWDQLNDVAKAVINAKLAPNTFEELLKQAQAQAGEETQATTEQEKGTQEKTAKDKAELAKTGDPAPVLPLALIALTSLGIAGVVALRRKNAA